MKAESKHNEGITRPRFPKRAVVTAGMPYGNKELHFGHVGGVFIPADVFSRFLKDRIGKDNVLFVSGTDCYGSAIEVSYDNLVQNGQNVGSIYDFVQTNHNKQKEVLEQFDINPDLFAASALGESGAVHAEVSAEVFEKLYKSGCLRLTDTLQFYDSECKTFLNGRQVVGKCPINGCKSEKAYANECSLGHQFMEEELIDPVSMISGKKPDLTLVRNWYFDLESFRKFLLERQESLGKADNVRKSMLSIMEEFYREPMIYVKREYMSEKEEVFTQFPKYSVIDDPQKSSVTLVFEKLADREKACEILAKNEIRYRTSKTLVPLRISGNVKWGIQIPKKDGVEGLTFWVWPESLWAPISFTKTALKMRGQHDDAWKQWWESDDADVYQFIGEDNIYFYCIAEMALFSALSDGKEQLIMPNIIPNHHILFNNSKASSSSAVKPPMASDLLNYYTAEQMRMHFLGMGLSARSINFQPNAFNGQQVPDASYDPVLKEGNLLTNVFNRLVRSCFYTAQKYFDSILPIGNVSSDVREQADALILEYERLMYRYEFNSILSSLDSYVRLSNKRWSAISKQAGDDKEVLSQLLIDSFHQIRVLTTLFHPMAPNGCDMIREYLNISEQLWNWDYIFEDIYYFMDNTSEHKIKFLEPRVDFFKKHESQLS